MPKRTKLFPLVLALLMFTSIARAQLSLALSALKAAYEGGQAYSLEIKTEIQAWPDVNDSSLDVMQAWLNASDISLNIRKREGQGEGAAQVLHRGLPVFRLVTRPEELQLQVGASFSTRYTGAADSRPSELLLGFTASLPDAGELQAAWGELARLALPLLMPYGETVKQSVTIKNAGRGVTQTVYQLKADEAQTLWQEASEELIPAFARLLVNLPNGDMISAALPDVTLNRDVSIKRFLTDEGTDLGLRITGGIDILGRARRLTLYGGMSEKGLYLSLKLPSVSGTDSLEVQVSLLFSAGMLKGDWRFEQKTGMEGLTLTGKVEISSESAERGERLFGVMTLRETRKGKVRRTYTYTLKPDFIINGHGLNGTLSLAQTEGKATLRSLGVTLSLKPAVWPELPPAFSEMDLVRAGEEDIALARNQIRLAFVPAIRDFLFSLPLETRQLVLHDWGRDGRTEGDSVPPLNGETEPFTVTDSADLYDTKEETP